MKKMMKQFGTALLIGLVAAVFIRGLSGCGGAEDGQETGVTPTTEVPVEEVAEAVEEVLPEGMIAVGNTICPVMQAPVADGEYYDWMCFRINSCCPGCGPSFNDEPEKYIPILDENPAVTQEIIDMMYECLEMDECGADENGYMGECHMGEDNTDAQEDTDMPTGCCPGE